MSERHPTNRPTDPTRRFTDRVEFYDRYRPTYPRAVVETLAPRGVLRGSAVVADVGSGTGILSRLLLEQGHRVFGVEPNPAMRRVAERRLADLTAFTSSDGRAEATGLGSAAVDAVTAAQAFHWFDRPPARREFRRILREGGQVVLLWNDRVREGGPFMEAYEAFLREWGTDYRQIDHRRIDAETLRQFFGGAGPELVTLDHHQKLDRDGLSGRLLSSSYLPGPEHPRHAAMLAAANRLFDEHRQDERVVIDYVTRMYYGPLAQRD